MNRILKIAVHEFRTTLRRPSFIFMTLAPLLMGLLVWVVVAMVAGPLQGVAEGNKNPRQDVVGMVDHSRLFTPIPAEYTNSYVSFPARESAQQALLAGEIGWFVVIPGNYLEAGKVETYTMPSGTKFINSRATKTYPAGLPGFLRHGLLDGKVDASLLDRVDSPLEASLTRFDSKGNPVRAEGWALMAPFFTSFAFSILFIMVVFGASGFLLTGMSEEREASVVELLLSAVSAMDLLAGKLLEHPNSPLALALSWIPFTSPTAMMLRLPMLPETPIRDIVISIAGLLVTIPLALWIGAKIFRMALLLTGKFPSLRQLLRVLRET